MQHSKSEEETVYHSIRFQIHQLTAAVAENEKRKQWQWKEDAEVLEAYVSALSATRQVLKEDQNRVLAKMEPTKKRRGRVSKQEINLSSTNFSTKSEVQEQLEEFRRRVKEAELRVEQAMQNLSVAVRTEERSMLEDQITIMGETRKLCLEEAQLLEIMLREMDKAEQKQKEQASDWEELARLKDQLTKLEAKIDQAKRCLLFPAVHGYRFRVGTGGIYVGAKDLYVSDLSASFAFSVESVRAAERTAVVKMHMGGREPRPTPLVIAETDRYDLSSPTEPHRSGVSGEDQTEVQSIDANAINNDPPSPMSVPSAMPTDEEEQSTQLSLEEASPEEPELTPSEETPVTDLAPVEVQEDPLSASNPAPLNLSQAEAGSRELLAMNAISVVPPVEAVTHSEANPIQQTTPMSDASIQDREAEVQAAQDPVHRLHKLSRGKNLATKFLSRIAEKSHLPKGVAKASQALFFTQQPKLRVNRSPSMSNTLLKKFVLQPEAPSAKMVNPVIPFRTALHYELPPQAPPSEAAEKLQVPSHGPKTQEDSASDFPPAASDSPRSSKESTKGPVEDPVEAPNVARHRSWSYGSFDRLESLSKRPSGKGWFESSSEIQSDATSLVGAGRRGVHVKLQGTHVSIVGEKGTRVPNMTVREITLEVECCLSVVFEFSEKQGWHSPGGLKFEVVQLKKKTVGNSIPLPAGLVKTLLNLILPKIVERAFVSALPKELGNYILESSRGMTAAGEVIVIGPPLSTTQAQLNTPSPFNATRSRPADLKAYSAVQEAQSLLSLSNDQAMLLGICFSHGRWGLLEPSEGWTGVCSIRELSRYYDRYASSEMWDAMCDIWNKALHYVARQQGMNCSLDFSALMNGVVSRLAAKPVRTQCLFTRLNCQLDVDAFLLALRDYCERSAREIQAEKPFSAALPLDQQLQALHEWYAQIKKRLLIFKTHFKSFMSAIIARADAKSLQIGLEKAHYEGPLHFQLPLKRDAQDSGLLSFDVSIPAPGDSSSTQFIDSLSRALRAIHVFKKIEHISTPKELNGEEPRLEWGKSYATDEKLDRVLQQMEAETGSPIKEAVPLGKAFLQKLRTSFTLNEDLLAQQLFNGLGAGAASVTEMKSVLEKLGDVVAGDLIPDADDKDSNGYLLTFQSSPLARFKCLIDSLGFQSTVSPAEVFSMMHICVREYLSTFFKDDVMRRKAADHAFKQVIKYVDKRSLDVIACSKLESAVHEGHLVVSLIEMDGTENGIRYPIQFTNDFDISSLMDSLTLAQGKLEA